MPLAATLKVLLEEVVVMLTKDNPRVVAQPHPAHVAVAESTVYTWTGLAALALSIAAFVLWAFVWVDGGLLLLLLAVLLAVVDLVRGQGDRRRIIGPALCALGICVGMLALTTMSWIGWFSGLNP
jgi:hypothetical protein